MDKKAIQKLIQELQKKVSAEPVKLLATNGVDDDFQNGNTSSEWEPPLHFNWFDAGENAAKVG